MDGLRGIAILMVLWSHGSFSRGFPHFNWWPFDGSPGVSLFFLMTGFLVTTILLDEKEKTGQIRWGNFFARRAFRIFPALYLYIAVGLVVRQLGWTSFSNAGWIASAGFWRNLFTGQNDWYFSHTWSLSLQEQFYLLSPLLVARLPRRWAMALTLAITAAWPLVRLARHGYLAPLHPHLALDNNGMDTILLGAGLAIMMRDGATLPAMRKYAGHILGLVAPVAVLWSIYAFNESVPHQVTVFLPLLRNLSCAAILWWCINNQKHAVGQFLGWKPLVFIGQISYGLYLWQQPFLGSNLGWPCDFPQNLIIAFVLAVASYYLVEMPANKFRSRWRNVADRLRGTRPEARPERPEALSATPRDGQSKPTETAVLL